MKSIGQFPDIEARAPLSYSGPVSEELRQLHEDLGISAEFIEQCQLPICREPGELVDAGADYYGRPQRLTAAANAAWQAMQGAAAQQGVVIHLISAFRAYEYQYQLIKRKLEAGDELARILTVNAAPGFSEHHTGRAIDIGTEDCAALEIEFEQTPAFRWLQENASNYGFSMTYPRGNPLGISYEPWHWCFHDSAKS